MNQALNNLYNGIMNDYSIRRYSMGWSPITEKLERRYKRITRTDIQFEHRLVTEAAEVATGSLKSDIEAFGRELGISLQTLREKYQDQRWISRG